ncbi:endonuclease/exonuclease/phosphatase family protein [Polynucleobacter necessarius]|uniref:hypothetical protein n=1 Tax=Polynucleobacter necessarius TaxID=576610 RepID=UPI001E585B92|nr:hypothetical protein [Polynucleobacter necessarius]
MSSSRGTRFTVMSMNVHKGLSPLHRHVTIHQLRQRMRSHHPDLLFCKSYSKSIEVECAALVNGR